MDVRELKLALVLAGSLVIAGCTPAPAGAGPSTAPSATASADLAPAVSLKINWTAVSGASSGLWTAFEAGYFREENLNAELVQIPSSSRAVAALLSKDVQFSHLDGQVTIDADIQGGGIKLIYGVNNRLVFSVMTRPEITKPSDLKGKKVGITSIGSSTHTSALLALRMWGLQPSDVTFIQLTEVPNILTGLIAGQIDAGVVSPPTNTRAKAAGFKELLNLATEGPEWPSIAVGATAAFLDANPTVGVRFVRAYARGVQRFKTDMAFGTTVLRKYLKLDDQADLDDTYAQYSKYLAEVPYVLGMQNTLDVVSATNDGAKTLKPEDLIEARYVKQLDDAGFFKKLYGR